MARAGRGGRGRERGQSRGGRRERGGRGGRDERPSFGSRGEMGRAELARNPIDKRARHAESQENAKRRKLEGEEEHVPPYATKFSQDEIESEKRRPKKKVAVLLGYSGSGYKGMQLNHNEKTIEGDLFAAFVAAGAISKANADDPRKSSLVRCARTDKGVHAAGNVISLKMIIEDPDIVSKINENLSSQIRVWGIEQTNGGFSAYQLCDSRIYEYLIPSHCFVPPHPRSFLGKKIAELAEEANDLEGYRSRQEDAAGFWTETEEKYIRPLLSASQPDLSERILTAFYETNAPPKEEDPLLRQELESYAKSIISNSAIKVDQTKLPSASDAEQSASQEEALAPDSDPKHPSHEASSLAILVHHLKSLHARAKKAYRIPPERLARIRSVLGHYNGSHRFHNYTIDKTIRNASATRVIKSFTISSEPIIISGTEWLSLKVHGQSFMMHQIRKMVSMVALIVRCGCPADRIFDTYTTERLSVPKAPSLGLLLERPVFDEYNKKLMEYNHATIDFSRHEAELEAFKQREIYERIFREEERDDWFLGFFASLDSTRSAQLLYLSSVGVDAVFRDVRPVGVGIGDEEIEEELDDDGRKVSKGGSMEREGEETLEREMEADWSADRAPGGDKEARAEKEIDG